MAVDHLVQDAPQAPHIRGPAHLCSAHGLSTLPTLLHTWVHPSALQRCWRGAWAAMPRCAHFIEALIFMSSFTGP